MTTLPTLSVVIPVYNSQESLPVLVPQLLELLPSLASAFEIILVDDGSRDQSWQVIRQLAQQDARLVGFHLARNYGQHNALLCGIRAARYEIIVTMDDDLQHPPGEIHKLLAQLEPHNTVVYGFPIHEQHGLWRDLASQLTKLALQSAMGAAAARHVSAFRAFHTRIRDAFADYRGSLVSIDVLLTWGTQNFKVVRVAHQPRQYGVSNYTFRKLLTHAVNMITGFSTTPLEVASSLGLLAVVFGMLVLVYVIARFFIEGYSVPGFPFLASIISIFAGVQLFVLGMMGEYLGRIHYRSLDRPSYLVEQATCPPQPEQLAVDRE